MCRSETIQPVEDSHSHPATGLHLKARQLSEVDARDRDAHFGAFDPGPQGYDLQWGFLTSCRASPGL